MDLKLGMCTRTHLHWGFSVDIRGGELSPGAKRVGDALKERGSFLPGEVDVAGICNFARCVPARGGPKRFTLGVPTAKGKAGSSRWRKS